MRTIENKIDFAVVFTVKGANPNGDPLNGNRPRLDFSGRGEISDVCLKRKIRNRLMDMGENIFVQSDENKQDDFTSLRARSDDFIKQKFGSNKYTKEEYAAAACQQWFDVRTFGQVFAFKGSKKDSEGVSVGIRGPVTIQSAFSADPVSISSIQITKSVNSEGDGTKKSSDTMGMKHRVDFGLYVTYGTINACLAKKTNFSMDDAEKLKAAICSMFENDASSARPEGTIDIKTVYWWVHDKANGQYPSSKVHGSLKIKLKENVDEPMSFDDYTITLENLEGLEPEKIQY